MMINVPLLAISASLTKEVITTVNTGTMTSTMNRHITITSTI